MDMISRILLYGPESLCVEVAVLLAELTETAAANIRHTSNWLELQSAVVEWMPSLTIVLAERHEAINAIMSSKRTRPDMPIFWFSEDADQSIRSHALECDYFGVKPVTKEHLRSALDRCAHIGIIF